MLSDLQSSSQGDGRGTLLSRGSATAEIPCGNIVVNGTNLISHDSGISNAVIDSKGSKRNNS